MNVRAETTRLLGPVHEAHRAALARIVLARWPHRPDDVHAATVDQLSTYTVRPRTRAGLDRWLAGVRHLVAGATPPSGVADLDVARALDVTGLHARLTDDLAELVDGVQDTDGPWAGRVALAQGLQVVQERLCDLDVALAVVEMLDHPDVPDRTWRVASRAWYRAHPHHPVAPLVPARLQLTYLVDETDERLLDEDALPALNRWSPGDVAPPRVTRLPWTVVDEEHRQITADPAEDARALAARLVGT